MARMCAAAAPVAWIPDRVRDDTGRDGITAKSEGNSSQRRERCSRSCHCGLDPQSMAGMCAAAPVAWIPDRVRDDDRMGKDDSGVKRNSDDSGARPMTAE